jgi:type VI secretion system protein ImpJ
MNAPPVHWHEGLFLRPHHLQAGERFVLDQLATAGRYDSPYHWGCHALRIDQPALANGRFEVLAVAARLRDGTLVVAEKGTAQAVPPVPEADLRKWLGQVPPGGTLDVRLGVPELRLGTTANTHATDRAARYRPEAVRLADENDGGNDQTVDTRRLNLRLFLGDENAAGYETLMLARVKRSNNSGAPPELDLNYVPPLLRCGASDRLAVGLLGEIYERVGAKVVDLARQVRTGGITFDTANPEQRRVFEQLKVLNEVYAAFGVTARATNLHPLYAYTEFCRVAGALAVFGKVPYLHDPDDPDGGERNCPAYDHDDLGGCFHTVYRMIDQLLVANFKQGYEERKFVGGGVQLSVAIEQLWLLPACQVLVGVESPNVSSIEAARLLTGRLNMKIAEPDRVDEIFRMGKIGLAFVHEHKPHPVLPTGPNRTYFRINTAASREEWAQVANTRRLAVRLNDRLLDGKLDGGPDVTIKVDGKTAAMRFSLFVVLPSGQ